MNNSKLAVSFGLGPKAPLKSLKMSDKIIMGVGLLVIIISSVESSPVIFSGGNGCPSNLLPIPTPDKPPMDKPDAGLSPPAENQENTIESMDETVLNPQMTIFTGNDHTGLPYKITFNSTKDDCKDLPEYMQNKAKSVDTHGTCVALCDMRKCEGRCISFYPTSPSHNRLRKLRFHRKAKSSRPCEPPQLNNNSQVLS